MRNDNRSSSDNYSINDDVNVKNFYTGYAPVASIWEGE